MQKRSMLSAAVVASVCGNSSLGDDVSGNYARLRQGYRQARLKGRLVESDSEGEAFAAGWAGNRGLPSHLVHVRALIS